MTDAIQRYLANYRKHEKSKQKKAAGEGEEGASSTNIVPDPTGGSNEDDVELSE